MSLCIPTTPLRSTKRTGQTRQSAISESLVKQQSPHIISIHILDNDSLVNIFYLYRPFFLGEDDKDLSRLHGGKEPWFQGRWWYRLAHVCQRWRNLILGSAPYLRLSLVCTNGTPVEIMLAHSPSLPLTIDYICETGIPAEDEEGILLALEQRHRVRHLRLRFPVQILQNLLTAIDEEFPILEYLVVHSIIPMTAGRTLVFPETLQAPHLRHLALRCFAFPIRPQLHPTTASLATLFLLIDFPSIYFQPDILLQWISFMPQLEELDIAFTFPVPNRDVAYTPITTHVVLSNLRYFGFRGVSAYVEAVVCRITTPRLEYMEIRLFQQLTFSLPRLALFMNTTENIRFDNAVIMFNDLNVQMAFFEANTFPFDFIAAVDCQHIDWQVSSVVQISNALGQVCSAVGLLTLARDSEVHIQSSEEQNDVDRIEWRNLLRSFSNLKTLRIMDGLVEELSHCLRLESGELPLELLPELQELAYIGIRDIGDAFTPFIDARQNAGRPVTLVRYSPNPLPSEPSATADL